MNCRGGENEAERKTRVGKNFLSFGAKRRSSFVRVKVKCRKVGICD